MENMEIYKSMYLNVENKRLVVTGGGYIMMDENVNSDLVDLLTKRIKWGKKTCFYLFQDIFKKLTDHSGLQPRKKKAKSIQL